MQEAFDAILYASYPGQTLGFRDRPAPIPIDVKSIDDTSNFDEFPDLDMNFEPSGNKKADILQCGQPLEHCIGI